MLIGHGSINGREFNTIEVDGGGFLLDIDPFFTIAFDLGGVASRIHQIEGSFDISFDASLSTSYRASLYGSADITVFPFVDISRSAFGHWSEDRRQELPGDDRGMHVEWQGRTIAVPPELQQPKEFRIMYVAQQLRVIAVQPETTVLVRQKEPML